MGTMIELTAADGHKLAAYRAEPAGKPRGAIVVIQEIFGVNSHIKAVADGYAADGYLVIAPAMYDRVQRGYETGYSQEDIQAGRLRAIGVCGARRAQALPNVPTVAETIKGFESSGWYALLGPAGLPRDVVNRLHDGFAKALQTPEITRRLAELGVKLPG